ncbi:MAG: spore cortex biosynthesis protein YabQ [Brotaphodocola sp.]
MSIFQEMRLLGLSILTGAGLMALYDCLRIFRIFVRHGWIRTGLEDILYWMFSGMAVFYLLYRENNGMIRWYVVACVFLTMIIYNRYISAFLLKWLKKAVRCFTIKVLRKRKNI